MQPKKKEEIYDKGIDDFFLDRKVEQHLPSGALKGSADHSFEFTPDKKK